MRSKHLLVGNWKMNLGPHAAGDYARSLRSAVTALKQTDVWVSPPTISLVPVAEALRGSTVLVGAQNSHWAESGAFTGETAPSFLRDIECAFTIVGHSERRTYFGETSEGVARRAAAGLAAGLTVIVCVGETEAARADGRTNVVLAEQLAPVLEGTPVESADRIVIAYEPVWAIGTGKVATIKEIAEAHRYIGTLWGKSGRPSSPVTLYGGSVNPQNFGEILALGDVDGALVGGASLKLDQWLELVRLAESTPI